MGDIVRAAGDARRLYAPGLWTQKCGVDAAPRIVTGRCVWADPMASEQRSGALCGVEFTLRIERRGSSEPTRCVLGATGSGENVGVGVPKPDSPRARVLAIQTAARQHRQRGVNLPEVATRAGNDDQQFRASLRVEPPDVRVAERLRGLLRATQGAFTVGDHRQVARVPGDSPGGPKFGERLGPFAGVIRSDSDGFAHRAHPGSTRSCGARELERAGRVGVDAFAGGDQILGDRLGVRLAERSELGTDAAVKQGGVNVLRDGRMLRIGDALGRAPLSARSLVSSATTARPVVEPSTASRGFPPSAAVIRGRR